MIVDVKGVVFTYEGDETNKKIVELRKQGYIVTVVTAFTTHGGYSKVLLSYGHLVK